MKLVSYKNHNSLAYVFVLLVLEPLDGAFKLNQRLGFDGGIDDFVDKPKGMHWKTFNRLLEKRDNYSAVAWQKIGLWMERRGWIDLKT